MSYPCRRDRRGTAAAFVRARAEWSQPGAAGVRSESVCRRCIQRADRLGEAEDLAVDQVLVELVEVQLFWMSSRTRLQQIRRQRTQRYRAEAASVERRAFAEEKRHWKHRDSRVGDVAGIIRRPKRVEVGLLFEVERAQRALPLGRVGGTPLILTGKDVVAIVVVGPPLAAEVLHRQAGDRLLVDRGMLVHPP